MNHFFYLNFGSKIGNGHYARCANIAKQLEKNDNIYLLTNTTEKASNNPPWKIIHVENKQDIVKILQQYPKEENIFIEDNYDIANHIEFEKEISKYVNKFIVIEDLNNRQHYCDIFINWNIYATTKEYSKLMLKENTQMLCGIQYWPCDEQFLQNPKNVEKNRVFVFLTSGDDKNMTLMSLKALEDFNYNIECVIGNLNPNKDKIKQYCNNKPNINLYIQTENIAQIMSKCEFAIGSFGQNTYERLYYHLPTIGIELADNQLLISKYCEEHNLAINLGWREEITIEKIVNVIKNKKYLEQNTINFQDTNNYLINCILINIYGFGMRKITIEDSERMFKWRNQDFIRNNMNTQHIIAPEEHNKWFTKIINSQIDKYFIFEYKKIPVGLICLNKITNVDCEFGFYIGEERFLNYGLGFLMEIFITKYVFEDLTLEKLHCDVVKHNTVAYNLYKKFGFEDIFQDEKSFYLILKKDIYFFVIKKHLERFIAMYSKISKINYNI